MPKLKAGTILPTVEEDAAITAAAETDMDARPFTDAEWTAARQNKVAISIRLDQAVLDYFRASGAGWQGRINAALREIAEGRQGFAEPPAAPYDASQKK